MIIPDELSEIQRALLQKNMIDLVGDTDKPMADYVRAAFRSLDVAGSPDITIRITSDGGSVFVGLAIYDIIKNYPGKTTGIVVGFARSMAAIILQACDIRQCYQHSKILIHHINMNQIRLDDLRNKKALRDISNDMEADQHYLYDIMIARTHQSKKRIKKTCRKDSDMHAKQAKKFGLIDEIIM